MNQSEMARLIDLLESKGADDTNIKEIIRYLETGKNLDKVEIEIVNKKSDK